MMVTWQQKQGNGILFVALIKPNLFVSLAREVCVTGSRSSVSNTMSLLSLTENIPRHLAGSYRHLKGGTYNLPDEVSIQMSEFMIIRDRRKTSKMLLIKLSITWEQCDCTFLTFRICTIVKYFHVT